MRKRVIKNLLLIVLTFIIAFTLGRITDWSFFEFSKEVSLVDILTLVVTIWLAYFVANVLEKDIQNIQTGKQLLIDRLGNSEEFLKRIDKLLYNERNSYKQIVNSIDRYLTEMNLTLQSIKDHKKKYKDLEPHIDSIKNKGTKLKELLTNTPEDRNDQRNMIMRQGQIRYTEPRLGELRDCFGLLENAIFDLKHTINFI